MIHDAYLLRPEAYIRLDIIMDIYSELLSALQTEDHVMLATIISTSGSTPASAFSKMLIKRGGTESVGTVGGGCLEGDVLEAAKRLYQDDKAEIMTFHLNEDEFVQGLICGGSLDVLIEPITKNDFTLVRDLKALRDEGEDCILTTVLSSSGKILAKVLVLGEDSSELEKELTGLKSSIPNLKSLLTEELHKAHHRNETRRMKLAESELILEPIQGTPSLIIFGGGHVSRYVCKAATMAGFRITVVDDRPQYANSERFPEAARTLATDYTEAFAQLDVKPSTYIVIVTRGHRYDEEILENSLRTRAKYIGMIGSKRKVFTTYEHLVERGVPVESLKRVRAPMGIEIGATTAEEIGISIVAELIAVRRGEDFPYFSKSVVMQDLFSRLEKKYSLS